MGSIESWSGLFWKKIIRKVLNYSNSLNLYNVADPVTEQLGTASKLRQGMKNLPSVLTFSTKLPNESFYVVVVWLCTVKKCTKIYNTSGGPLFSH